MKYPCLVPKRLCRTEIHVHLETEEITNLGMPAGVRDLDLKCNFQDRARTVLTAEKKLVQATGTALFPGDIAPDMPSLSAGTVTVFGQEPGGSSRDRRPETRTGRSITAVWR